MEKTTPVGRSGGKTRAEVSSWAVLARRRHRRDQGHRIYTAALEATRCASSRHWRTNRGSRVIGLVGRSMAAPDSQPAAPSGRSTPSSAFSSTDEHVDDSEEEEADEGTDRDTRG